MAGWAVAVATRRIGEWTGKWREEFGPRLPGERPRRLLSYAICATVSFECLVLAEIGNRQAQGIDGDQVVGHAALEVEDEIGGIEIAL
jgi:hypothetical protein